MNRFNLEFSGEILPDRDPEQVKARFGRFFAIDDPTRLERFFSGRTIVLRRNLERKAAAGYFVSLRRLGVEIRLVKAGAGEDSADPPVASSVQEPPATPAGATETRPDLDAQPTRQQSLPLELPPEPPRASEPVRESNTEQPPPGQPERKPEPGKRAGRQTARQKALANKARRKQAKKAARRVTRQARVPRQSMSSTRVDEVQGELPAVHEDEAEQVAAARQTADEEARKQALAEEAAEKARLKAAEEAARQQALEAAARQRREAAIQAEALREATARQAAEKAAGQRALEAPEQHGRKAGAAERVGALREATAAQASTPAGPGQAEQARREAAQREAAKRRGRRDAEYARRRALQAMENQAMQRAAAALAQQPALKPAATRARGNVSIAPLLKARRPSTAPVGTPRRRQPGAPNIYSLSAFRNTPQVRNRAAQARLRRRNGIKLALAALAALLILGGRYLSLPAPQILSGAGAIAVDANLRPVMLAGDRLLLHDRSGTGAGEIELAAMGLAALQAPLAFEPGGDLLGVGRLAGNPGTEAPGTLDLLRCTFEPPGCRPFTAAAGVQVDALAIHPLTGVVFIADAGGGRLLKFSGDGEQLASAPAAMPAQPVLQLDSGLLFMNSAQGPAISVFRYENEAFGRQLDEILLLPPSAVTAEQSRARDFLWSAGSWWVTLDNPESGSVGIYRFDPQWNFTDQVTLAADEFPGQLVAWGEKILLRDSGQVPVQRFNAQGGREAPLVSQSLQALVEGQERSARLSRLAWRGGLTLCAALALLGLGYSYLQQLRALVYQPRRERGADPIDERADAVDWVDPVSNRDGVLRRRIIHYTVLALALLLLAIGFGVTTTQLAALLVALAGPAVALALVRRSPAGHIGVLQRELVLVDHAGTYHLGGGARIQHRGNLLMIDDVLVFAGNRLLPAFDQAQIASRIAPLVRSGVRVDRKTAVVKLLQGRHPLARSAIVVLLALLAAALLLSLPA